MGYDPNFPPDHQALTAAPFRAQFQGLKSDVNAVPTSPQMMDVLAAQTAGSIADLDFPDLQVSDPPTRDEVLAIVNYLTDLHAYLQRQ
jgi:hypothetical protein